MSDQETKLYKTQVVMIDALDLDTANPRHDPVVNSTEAVQALLAGKGGEKLLRLAEDIAKEGPNPAELPIIMPSGIAGRFTVLEGNRRIACLKLLKDPSSVDLPGQQPLRRRFDAAARLMAGRVPEQMECLVVDNSIEARHWIELRHTGEREGAGIVKWGSAASARFSKGQNSTALQVLDHVRKSADLDSGQKRLTDPKSFPITNLSRLMNDPDVRETVGIEIVGGDVQSTADKDQVLKALTRVVLDVGDGTVTVNRISHNEVTAPIVVS